METWQRDKPCHPAYPFYTCCSTHMAFCAVAKVFLLFTILGVLLFYKVFIVASFLAPLPQSFDIICANAEVRNSSFVFFVFYSPVC